MFITELSSLATQNALYAPLTIAGSANFAPEQAFFEDQSLCLLQGWI